jgi:hypothetical protein
MQLNTQVPALVFALFTISATSSPLTATAFTIHEKNIFVVSEATRPKNYMFFADLCSEKDSLPQLKYWPSKSSQFTLSNRERRKAHLNRIRVISTPPIQQASTSKKKEGGYFMFTLSAGRFPLPNLNSYPSVKFDYSYNYQPQTVYTYEDSVRLMPHASLLGIGGGLEFGRKKGIFVGLTMGALASHYKSEYIILQLGYNIALPVKKFTLQPSLAYTHTRIITDFKTISMGTDVTALNTIFPWKTCSTGHSDYVNVQAYNNLNFLQYKLDLKYNVTAYVAFKLGAVLWTQLSNTTDLYLSNQSKGKKIDGKVHTSTAVSQADLQKNSRMILYLDATFLFTFKLPPPTKSTSGSHSSHSSYHHYSGGHFHSCH